MSWLWAASNSSSSFADYYFVTREVMQRDIAAGDFIEHAEFSGNLYGTRWAAPQSSSQTSWGPGISRPGPGSLRGLGQRGASLYRLSGQSGEGPSPASGHVGQQSAQGTPPDPASPGVWRGLRPWASQGCRPHCSPSPPASGPPEQDLAAPPPGWQGRSGASAHTARHSCVQPVPQPRVDPACSAPGAAARGGGLSGSH